MTLKTRPLSEPFGTLSYRTAGTGTPLVLLHGVGMQSAAWEPQIAALSQSTHVVALDMPGHGGTAPLPKGAVLPDYVNWLHAALTALDLGPVNLAGHSMGALIAGGYAITHPQMVQRVALLNGVFRRTDAARAAVVARAKELETGAPDLDTPLKRWFSESPSDQAARDLVEGWLKAVDLDGYATAYGAFATGDQHYADAWSDIDCPLLALTGSDDPNSTPAMAEEMARIAQNGHTHIVAGHRHMANLTAVEEVNRVLADWLSWPVAGHHQRRTSA
jgi:pimeloyl-ACP methyl ester carboxylesterase